MSKCLVTGGAGFIGSHLTDELIRQGHDVTVIDDLSTGRADYVDAKAVFHRLDICSPEAAAVIAENKPDCVFHLAAQVDVRVSVADPERDNRINVLGGVNVLSACRRAGVKRVVFTSTGGAIYGDADVIPTPENYEPRPISPYGIHKLAMEKYLHYFQAVYGLPYAILRLANIYGPRQYRGGEAGVISIFIDNAVHGRVSDIFGTGQATRDYVFVGDVVDACLKAAKSEEQNLVANIGTGRETSVLGLVSLIETALGDKMAVEHKGARAGEQMRSCLDAARAEECLGWRPRKDLAAGIKETITWARAPK